VVQAKLGLNDTFLTPLLSHCRLPLKVPVLTSEIDQAKRGLIRKVFIKEGGAEIFFPVEALFSFGAPTYSLIGNLEINWDGGNENLLRFCQRRKQWH
jgi:hypothetical protein